MKFKYIIAILIIFRIPLQAQKSPVKFGEIDKEALGMTTYVLDSGADAVVLADYGRTIFTYNQQTGFTYTLEHTKRIKIITSDGYHFADIQIPLYGDNGDREVVTKVRGYTYNLTNGKVVKSKLEKSAKFTEAYDQNYTLEKFTMPDVKEGSVIEYQYTLTSPFWNHLPTWEFQNTIPVLYSEYYVTIPEYFKYHQLSFGYHPFEIADTESVMGKINITSMERPDFGTGRQTAGATMKNESVDYTQTRYHWIARDVPAFKKEAYMNAIGNYITKIEFELRATQFPGDTYKTRMGTWASLNKTYLKAQQFGMALGQVAFIKDDVQTISLLGTNEEKISAATAFVKKEMVWNGDFRMVASNNLRKSWNEKKGSSADINFILIAALRKLKIDADPVIISTRNHGLVIEQFALSRQFNSVLALARDGDKQYLLDATNKYLPTGVLPVQCLNGRGYIISDSNPGWVDLKPAVKSEKLVAATLTMDNSGILKGKVIQRLKGYESYGKWKTFIQKGKDAYVEDLRKEHKEWVIENVKFPEEVDISNPFYQEAKVELLETAEVTGSIIVLDPMLTAAVKQNPFTLEERKFPVDYVYGRKYTYVLSLTIPDGFVTDDLPEPVRVALPDNGGSFQYSVNVLGNTLSVSSTYSLNKPLYLPEEYEIIRQFYNIIVDKHAEQVVLKRKT